VFFIGAGLMSTFFLLALYLQQVLDNSPLLTGVSVRRGLSRTWSVAR
jgi:hypothetical protein